MSDRITNLDQPKLNKDYEISSLGYHQSEALLYSNFIKYKKLYELCMETIAKNKTLYEVNVFIDLQQFLLPLYSFADIENPMGLLATMSNMPLHYRAFFNSYKVKSNIFVIFSYNKSYINYRYIGDYNSKNLIKVENNDNVRSIIDRNISLMKTLFPYLPGIYLKTGTVEPSVIAYDIIDKFTRKGNNTPNVFISNSDYSFQLPAVLNNTYLFYKKKVRNEESNKQDDVSFSVSNKDALVKYISHSKNQIVDIGNINSNWVSTFMLLNGLPCRGIKSLVDYNKSINTMKYIKDNYNVVTPENIYNALITIDAKNKIAKKYNLLDIEARLHAIDIDYQLKLYRELPESLETSFLNDLYDMDALYKIATTYFNQQNPLNIEKL